MLPGQLLSYTKTGTPCEGASDILTFLGIIVSNTFDDFVSYLIVAIIVGGRLGYVIFYNLEYFLSNPFEIIKVWEGGMSFHGALIGIIVGTYLFSIKKNVPTFFLLDVIACVSPIGIFLGRTANFINGELVGKVIDKV